MTADGLRLERLPAADVAPGAGPPRRPAEVPGRRRAQPPRRRVRRRLGGAIRGRAGRDARRVRASRRSSTSTAARATALSARDRRDGRRPRPDRVVVVRRPGRGRLGRPIRRSARRRRAQLRDAGRSGRPRAQGLEDARPARARPGRPAGRGRRRAARPAVGGRRRPGPPGRHPHRRPGRLLRAARPDQRALGGAARPPGLALLAGPARRRPRRPGVPGFDALLAAFERLVGRHPRTTFIGAHVGCAAEDLALVAGLLDAHPNLHVDIAARLGELGRQPYTARAFFLRYADRILFGADLRPGPGDLRGALPVPRDVRRVVRLRHRPGPGQGRWQIHGIGLPDDVLRKVYRDNARRLFAAGAGDDGARVAGGAVRPWARGAASRPAPPSAARSRCSRSTIARTCARSCGRPTRPR